MTSSKVCVSASDQQTYPPARVTSGTTARAPLAWRCRTARAYPGPVARGSQVLLEVGDQRVGRRDVHAVGFDELRHAMERVLMQQFCTAHLDAGHV